MAIKKIQEHMLDAGIVTKLDGGHLHTGKSDIAEDESITGLWTMQNGLYTYSANYGFNNAASSDKYLRVMRVKFTQAYGRAYVSMPLIITGTQTKKGMANFYIYEATLKTLHANTYAYINNIDSVKQVFGNTDMYYQQWTGTTNDYIDVWVKLTDYARFVHNIEMVHVENGVTITINPDGATTSDGVGLQSSIPAISSTDIYDGESVTAQDGGIAFTGKTPTMT